MRESTVAKVYAEALLQIAHEQNAVEEIGSDLADLVSLLEADRTLKIFFESPQVDKEDKKRAILNSLKGVLSDTMVHFLLVAVEKNRQYLLKEMRYQYEDLLDRRHNRMHVKVKTAVNLDDDMKSKLKRTLSDFTRGDVIVHYEVGPEILGGVVAQVGDVFLDGSIRTRLNNLRESLLNSEIRSEEVYEDTT